ncbi:MAG: hypothetical protein ABI611_01630 [Solirubrobacteraceae bacterium]
MADHLPGGWLPPQAPGPPQPPEPPQGPVFVRGPAEQGTNGLAIAAIVCAISSIALLVLSLGLSFPFSLPLGISGWICATRARIDVRGGQRRAGLVLAIAAIALSALAALVWIVLIAAGFSVDELQRNLENELQRQRRAGG